LSDESEHGSQGPSEYAALFTWQPRDNFAPAAEFSRQGSGAVQKSIEAFSESPRATFGLQRVTNCHLFKGEEKICARLNFNGLDSDLKKPSAGQLRLIGGTIQYRLPFLMCP
jgi:hypothetical protein